MGFIERQKLKRGLIIPADVIEEARSGVEERSSDTCRIKRRTKGGLILISSYKFMRGSLTEDPDFAFFLEFDTEIFTPDGKLMEHLYKLHNGVYGHRMQDYFLHTVRHPPGRFIGTRFVYNFHRPLIKEAYEEFGMNLPINC